MKQVSVYGLNLQKLRQDLIGIDAIAQRNGQQSSGGKKKVKATRGHRCVAKAFSPRQN
jgi:hypothetical protein